MNGLVPHVHERDRANVDAQRRFVADWGMRRRATHAGGL